MKKNIFIVTLLISLFIFSHVALADVDQCKLWTKLLNSKWTQLRQNYVNRYCSSVSINDLNTNKGYQLQALQSSKQDPYKLGYGVQFKNIAVRHVSRFPDERLYNFQVFLKTPIKRSMSGKVNVELNPGDPKDTKKRYYIKDAWLDCYTDGSCNLYPYGFFHDYWPTKNKKIVATVTVSGSYQFFGKISQKVTFTVP